MQPSSPFNRVKASFTRSQKPDSPSPSTSTRKRPLSRIFSSSSSPRSAKFPDSSSDLPPPPHPPPQPADSNPPPSAHSPSSPSLDANASRARDSAALDHDTSHAYTDVSAFDERDMKRRLMDMESSFLPDPNSFPEPHAATTADARPATVSPVRQSDATSSHVRNFSTSSAGNPGDAPRPLQFHRPLSYIRNEAGKAQSESGDASPLHHSFSSPSADAARRSGERLAARARSPSRLSGAPVQNRNSLPPQLEGGSFATVGKTNQPIPDSDEISTSQAARSPDAAQNTSDAGASPANNNDKHVENSQTNLVERPEYLKQRQASQRSSGSSFLSYEGASDLGNGGSGGVTPGSLSTVKPGSRLSRLPSLGSVASSMSATTERKRNSSGVPMAVPDLEPLDEERTKSTPNTPQNNPPRSADPSQTVLAQNVRNVEVPATVARKFRASQAPDSTGKSSLASPLFSRVKNELTLKEQNSRIDKLSKENFDLKLKIHYLYQALQDRSDEGVKDLISKNAQLQADAVRIRKDNQSLKKRVRELERDLRARDDGLSAIRTTTADESEDAASSRSFRQGHLEDEIIYLRDRMQVLEADNERLRLGDATHKLDDRRLAERLQSLDLVSDHDEADRLRAELRDERLAREQADHLIEELRIELSRQEDDRSPVRDMLMSSTNAQQAPNFPDDHSLSGSTLVEQLRTENANLRRDLGAQTSMLSSRNRERERLQQEIEDLKLVQRRGDLMQQPSVASISGDSILDRSVSRNQMRPASRDGGLSASMSDAERDEFENREARLRDENAALRMRNQDLQKDLDMISYGGEHLATLRDEHDEAVRLISEERDLAADTIDKLESLIEQKDQEVEQLLVDLRAREDEGHAFEVEIREISASLSRVVDDSESRESTIQDLQADLAIANGELEAMEQNFHDVQASKERLEVQAESSQSEIAFLRDEQESDKIKLSDLQSALSRAKANLRGEKEKLRALEELEAEAQTARDESRELRKLLEAKEQEAASHQSSFNELDRGLRQILGNHHVGRTGVVSGVKRMQRDLDNALRELNRSKATMGERERQIDETRALVESHTNEAEQLHAQLDRERQARRHDRAELEKLRQRGANNSRVEELERELKRDRQALASLEEDYQFHLRERSKLMYNVWTRVAALCGSDWLTKYATEQGQEPPTFESVTADPLSIDEPLSLALDMVSQHLGNYRTRVRATEKELFRGLDSLSRNLDERTKRVEALERLTGGKRTPGHGSPAKLGTSGSASMTADLTAVKEENKILKREIKVLRQANFSLPGLKSPQIELDRTEAAVAKLEREREMLHTQHHRPSSKRSAASPASTARSRTGDGASEHSDMGRKERENSVMQVHPFSMGAHSTAESIADSASASGAVDSRFNGHPTLLPSEQKWVLRLKDLERRLLAEREGRVLDRDSARERLKQGKAERESLRQELEREREKGRLKSLRDATSAEAERTSRGPRGRRLIRESEGGGDSPMPGAWTESRASLRDRSAA